jgi:DNA-binding MarR family transcriptional regulator
MDAATARLLERITRRVFTRIMTGVARTMQDEDLTIGQVATVFLVDDGESTRVADVAEALGLSASATSRLVDGLVERGYLARELDPDDRRARRLSVTAEGRAFVQRLGKERMGFMQRIVGHMPSALVRTFLEAVDRVTDLRDPD